MGTNASLAADTAKRSATFDLTETENHKSPVFVSFLAKRGDDGRAVFRRFVVSFGDVNPILHLFTTIMREVNVHYIELAEK